MIIRKAVDRERFAHRLLFTSSSRIAWKLILESLTFPDNACILLPAYIGITDREGSGIMDPVESTNISYSLYYLDDHLRPDLLALESLLKTRKYHLLLIVHYFGIVHVDLIKLKKLCELYDVLLIEDCAHVPYSIYKSEGPGSVGDAAFYSLHKSIAVNSGGILRINNLDIRPRTPSDLERCDRHTLEQFIRVDMYLVANKRRKNYQCLLKYLKDIEGITILYPNIENLVPHDFPILVHDELREKLYFELLKEGMPTIALYYRLIDVITLDAFPISHMISKSILNLPVHQDTNEEDLKHLAKKIKTKLLDLRLN